MTPTLLVAGLMRSFCYFVYFSASSGSAARWIEAHPGSFTCSVEEAFALGQRLTERSFGHALRSGQTTDAQA